MVPKLDTLFLALPISWKGSLAQYAGCIHRIVENRGKVAIYDYVDTSMPMLLRMFKRRGKGYEAMGYNLVGGVYNPAIKIQLPVWLGDFTTTGQTPIDTRTKSPRATHRVTF